MFLEIQLICDIFPSFVHTFVNKPGIYDMQIKQMSKGEHPLLPLIEVEYLETKKSCVSTSRRKLLRAPTAFG